MKKIVITLFIAMLALAGCNTKKDEPAKKEKLEEVKVAVQTNPKEIKPNEKTEVQALVTQGKEKVTDADDVKFEIWKDGEEKHEMLDGKHKGKGVYAVEKTFPSDGVYHVIAHTNAREMHVMPEVKVAVGNAKVKDAKKENGGHGDHKSDTMIHLMADDVKVNAESTMKVHLKQKEEALTGAEVQLEVWKDGVEKHEFIPAKEGNKGEYVSKHTFKETGAYKVKVHVRKGELHEHKEETVEVK
ncbi:FixH family protein [Bacillus bingmayongensis]|uniref:FixH family protein n=1 Tax=Bacillus bingmayongensis TaxID=1150157 RepID=UPI0002D46CAC|nr:FixH family protein [Bacillus bingmayongensis]MBY0597451.1 FixH family protein [Bacillus bingmayongensis]